MTGGGNADSKWGEKKMEVEDSVRTVDCLRGRLLAERVASRNAKQEAEQLEHELMELEKLLKQEAKSRNRAEKRLKFLLKKLESLSISYVSDESQHSGLMDKTDISSVSSTTTSNNGSQQMKIPNTFKNQESDENAKSPKGSKDLLQKFSQSCLSSLGDDSSANEGNFQESDENAKSPKGSNDLQLNFSQSCLSSLGDDSSANEGNLNVDMMSSEDFEQNIKQHGRNEDSLSSASDLQSEISSHPGLSQDYNNSSKMDEQSDMYNHSVKSCAEEGCNQEDDQEDPDYHVDNSMALVLVNTPQKVRPINPEVLDATVKQVLDSLRRAREQLQSSMERRRTDMIKVG